LCLQDTATSAGRADSLLEFLFRLMITENLGQRGIQRAFLMCVFSACFFLVSCGGGAPKPTIIVSKVADRVFVSNQQTNALQVVDGQRDKVTTFNVATGVGPTS